ncbi:MAG: TolC family outer membrane protein [Pseudomonadota bacterium]
MRDLPKSLLLSRTLAVTGLAFALSMPAAATETINLVSAFRQGLTNDPTFLSAAAQNRAAKELIPQAEAALLPSVQMSSSFNANLRYDFRQGAAQRRDSFFNAGLSLSLTQPIYRQDLRIQIRQANTQVEQADAQFAFAMQALIVRVADRYFAVLAAGDALEFAQAEKNAIEQQLTQSQQRFEVGLIAITDVEEARAGFDLATAQVIAAENNLAGAYEALREVTGVYQTALWILGPDSPTLVVPEPNNIDSWTETALRQNRELEAARLQVVRQRDEIRLVESGHLPTVSLVGSSGVTFQNGAAVNNSRTIDSAVGLQLSMPIYQGGLLLSQARSAQHSHEQALEDQERQRRATQRLARDSFRGVLSGISQVKALKQALVSARSALEAIEAGFQVGTRTSVDVLNAQRELFRTQRDYSQARYDYILSILRLKQAAGTLAPPDLAQVNEWLQDDA